MERMFVAWLNRQYSLVEPTAVIYSHVTWCVNYKLPLWTPWTAGGYENSLSSSRLRIFISFSTAAGFNLFNWLKPPLSFPKGSCEQEPKTEKLKQAAHEMLPRAWRPEAARGRFGLGWTPPCLRWARRSRTGEF